MPKTRLAIAHAEELLHAAKEAYHNLHERSHSRKHWSVHDQRAFDVLDAVLRKAAPEMFQDA